MVEYNIMLYHITYCMTRVHSTPPERLHLFGAPRGHGGVLLHRAGARQNMCIYIYIYIYTYVYIYMCIYNMCIYIYI